MKALDAAKKAQQARNRQAQQERAAKDKEAIQKQRRETESFPRDLTRAKRSIAKAAKDGDTSITLNPSGKVGDALRKLGYRISFHTEQVDHGDFAAPCVCTEHYMLVSWEKP